MKTQESKSPAFCIWFRKPNNREGVLDERNRIITRNPTIGLLLCKSKNKVVAEYALRDKTQPIGVAEYQLIESLPAELQTSLPSIEQIENELKDFQV